MTMITPTTMIITPGTRTDTGRTPGPATGPGADP